ncbi:MAG: glycosyltransferase family 2 protein, partial [Gammaproteobacteria bacterium]|nr:glycosyltransferase family 2 protein [Gammaproteobacteria bacterium]
MIRMYAMYKPLRVFFYIGLSLTIIGVIPIIRFLFFYFMGNGGGNIQSLVLGGVLLIMGFITLMIGLVADLISFNRQLTEITLEKIRKIELQLKNHRD